MAKKESSGIESVEVEALSDEDLESVSGGSDVNSNTANACCTSNSANSCCGKTETPYEV